jgi:16S rRNA G966 N2-methylase RsmD
MLQTCSSDVHCTDNFCGRLASKFELISRCFSFVNFVDGVSRSIYQVSQKKV